MLRLVIKSGERSDSKPSGLSVRNTSTNMLEIETQNLTKSFGRLAAVQNLNLQIPKGTIFGFLGPNGSGKSTTVKLLTGLLRPTAGEALIGGRKSPVRSLTVVDLPDPFGPRKPKIVPLGICRLRF